MSDDARTAAIDVLHTIPLPATPAEILDALMAADFDGIPLVAALGRERAMAIDASREGYEALWFRVRESSTGEPRTR